MLLAFAMGFIHGAALAVAVLLLWQSYRKDK